MQKLFVSISPKETGESRMQSGSQYTWTLYCNLKRELQREYLLRGSNSNEISTLPKYYFFKKLKFENKFSNFTRKKTISFCKAFLYYHQPKGFLAKFWWVEANDISIIL